MKPTQTSEPTLVGKKELCAALNWARTRLDRRLNSDSAFPVVTRGDRSGGWQFDLGAVLAYLDAPKPASRAAAPRAVSASAAAPNHVELPPQDLPPSIEHRGEMTQRQRRDAAQAGMLEDKLRIARGELVRAEDMRMVLTTMLAKLGKGLDSLPDAIVSRLALPEEQAVPLQLMVDELRQTMVRDLRKLLSPPPDV